MIKYCNQNQLKEEVCLFMVAFPECESVRAGKAQPAGRSRKLLAGAGSWVVIFCWHTGIRQKENRKWEVFTNCQSTPQ